MNKEKKSTNPTGKERKVKVSRFEMICNTYVNVDRIRSFWREGEKREILVVELDDGQVLKERDERCVCENNINGYEHIIQIIPCIKPLYVRYRGEGGKEYEYPIYYIGLCASGYVRPLDVCGADEIFFADDASNFVGLYSESLEEERKENK